MRNRPLLLSLSLATLLAGGSVAFAAKKKAKKADDASALKRITVYDPDQPKAPPRIIVRGSTAKVPDAPLIELKLGKEPEDSAAQEHSVILDKAKPKESPKESKDSKDPKEP